MIMTHPNREKQEGQAASRDTISKTRKHKPLNPRGSKLVSAIPPLGFV